MFEVGNTYKTREGLDARLIYRRASHKYPLVWIVNPDENDKLISTTEEGCHMKTLQSELDIMPPVKVAYLNIYRHRNKHESRIVADAWGASDRIACVRVEYYEGQFDD